MLVFQDDRLHPNKSEHRRLFEKLRMLILKVETSLGSQGWLSAKHLLNATSVYRSMNCTKRCVRLEMDAGTWDSLGHLIKRKVDNWVDGVSIEYKSTTDFQGVEVSWIGILKHHRWRPLI